MKGLPWNENRKEFPGAADVALDMQKAEAGRACEATMREILDAQRTAAIAR